MSVMRNGSALACITAALGVIFSPVPAAQIAAPASGRAATIASSNAQALRQWDAITQTMLRSGELRVRQVRDDTQLPGRVIERADQYHRGVRVFGADISRQIDAHGGALSVFGHVYDGIAVPVDPGLTSEEVRTRVAALAGTAQAEDNTPELMVLPRDGGASFRLAW